MIDRKAFRFFLGNAGGIVGQSAITAASLARAEAYARDHDWRFVWEYDQDRDTSWCETCEHLHKCRSLGRDGLSCDHVRSDHDHQLYDCMLYDSDGEMLECLGGNDFGAGRDPWGEPYKRVVEAELASEALHAIEQAERALWTRYDQAIERTVTA